MLKAPRYLTTDRYLEQDQGGSNVQDEFQPTDNPPATDPAPDTIQVDVGQAMPPARPGHLPVLHPQVQAGAEAPESARSMLAEGMRFEGNALLRGPCSIAGQVDGHLTQATGASVAVVVTETGTVKGNITAQKISVMGHTDGILDAGQGEVSLHDTARVHGLVRYGRIQVNGADLNATLERVATQKPVA